MGLRGRAMAFRVAGFRARRAKREGRIAGADGGGRTKNEEGSSLLSTGRQLGTEGAAAGAVKDEGEQQTGVGIRGRHSSPSTVPWSSPVIQLRNVCCCVAARRRPGEKRSQSSEESAARSPAGGERGAAPRPNAHTR
ncbi:uncharacterized protein A4U43_C04F35270 [Asparagus officinalis]|uniref:Uncharacterized protein n=1 Tax=Asparagus officinalis TaxID=4686 RepID=A0A5P1F5Z4_ASPOF|nr:uncharacterized protein A4U43_C04F35270 [Asparagus officinalis]